ncbi:MAG: VOC family protein [Blastocatellia bacterium]|nr:VOC family protein [Blastocatellia bacterium]
MADANAPVIGSIGWMDLTVENADQVRDFYSQVAGWQSQGLDMGGYEDYVMMDPSGKAVGGVCHARGGNVGLPKVWMIYIVVEDLDASLARCREFGGEAVTEPKIAGGGRYCVVRDPAGVAVALYQTIQPPSADGKPEYE